MKRELELTITEYDQGMALQRFLQKHLGFTRGQISSLKFQNDGIRINGEKVRVSHLLQSGEKLVLSLEEQESEQLIPVEKELCILYEDQDVICVWKDEGIPVHPAGVHYQDSLANYLRAYFLQKGEKVLIRSIGRLDLETSGIMVFAKNRVAAARLWKEKEDGIFQKEYLAECEGRFPKECWEMEQKIEIPLKNKDPYTMEAAPGDANAKQAVTYYQVVGEKYEHDRWNSRVKVRIQTGRMHQIRVHMAFLEHPLTGDRRYGNIEKVEGREQKSMRLCAHKICFLQPYTGEKIQLSGAPSWL